MNPVNNLGILPEIVKLDLVLQTELNVLPSLLVDHSMLEFISRPYVLKELARTHGLPFSDSLASLLKYSSMSPEDLLNRSAKNGDIRVAKAVSETSSLSISDY